MHGRKRNLQTNFNIKDLREAIKKRSVKLRTSAKPHETLDALTDLSRFGQLIELGPPCLFRMVTKVRTKPSPNDGNGKILTFVAIFDQNDPHLHDF